MFFIRIALHEVMSVDDLDVMTITPTGDGVLKFLRSLRSVKNCDEIGWSDRLPPQSVQNYVARFRGRPDVCVRVSCRKACRGGRYNAAVKPAISLLKSDLG